jgi:hypothetical protein
VERQAGESVSNMLQFLLAALLPGAWTQNAGRN